MKALLIIDVQNDFLPGGALAVPEGDAVVPVINKLLPAYDLVVATQDWHPAVHGSFAANHPGKGPGEMIRLGGLDQILWPVHCVQGSRGAAFAPSLDTGRIDHIVQKGGDPGVDSYSGFFDNGRRNATGLAAFLRKKGVTEIHLVGLATDYCVKFTALDALAEGFKTVLIEDACRGVNLEPGDVERAITKLREAGAAIAHSNDPLAEAPLFRPAPRREELDGRHNGRVNVPQPAASTATP